MWPKDAEDASGISHSDLNVAFAGEARARASRLALEERSPHGVIPGPGLLTVSYVRTRPPLADRQGAEEQLAGELLGAAVVADDDASELVQGRIGSPSGFSSMGV